MDNLCMEEADHPTEGCAQELLDQGNFQQLGLCCYQLCALEGASMCGCHAAQQGPWGEEKWASPPAILVPVPLAGGAEGRPAQKQLATSHMQTQQVGPDHLVSTLCGCTLPGAASGGSKCSWHKQTAPWSCP